MKPRVRRDPPGPALGESLGGLLHDAAGAVDGFAVDPAERAHWIRVRVKRLQALSHLVPRGGVWRRCLLPVCRELKDGFAATRDATILQVLIAEHGCGGTLPPPVAPAPDLARAGGLVTAAAMALATYREWPEIGLEEMVERAVRSYRLARRTARAAACGDAPDAAFHRLRRRVKRLLYQCEFLGGWVAVRGMVRDLERLSEVLGALQDVCVAREWLRRHGGVPDGSSLRRLRNKLRRRALRKAGKLFAMSVPRFRRRHTRRLLCSGRDVA